MRADSSVRSSFVLHSHMIATFQPERLSKSSFFLSRSMLAENFFSQNSVRVFGVVVFEQPWRCQKQPCTNTAIRRLVNTKSGDPGSVRTQTRYLKPIRYAALRTASSADVSRWRTAAMIRLRVGLTWVGSWLSVFGRIFCLIACT